MKIIDLLNIDSIQLNGTAKDKTEILNQVVDLMDNSGRLTDVSDYKSKVFAREEEGTTGIGEGVAIPHGRSAGVREPGLAAMVLPNGVDFESLDDEPVYLIFLIAAPEGEGQVHLDILKKLSAMLLDETFVASLRAAKSPEEFLEIIDAAEAKRDQKVEKTEDIKTSKAMKKVLAVTACPTGIAHTYMAAEALEKAAKNNGVFIKVETRGSGGAKNILTEEEILEADFIIIAADTKIPMERFDGKKLIEVRVSDGISKADLLIKKAMNGEASIYKGTGENKETSVGSKGGKWHQVYKHLMSGVSHMLPFVVGGGILIAIAFLIDGFSIDINALSAEQRGNFGSITSAAAIFKQIGGAAFGFMLPILAGFIAMSIADRPGLAVGFIGGAIAANGNSGFLGALAAGFMAGYIVKLLQKLFDKLPKSLEGTKPVLLYPVLGILSCGLLMNFAIEPIVGVINTSLNNGLSNMSGASSILLGIILSGMMAVDMGGPFNKAAYVFGTASIAAGNYNIMAAVMIGGMVPPCAIALATILFKNKFTSEERKSGPTNFIMGLAFITEGAIPYAAADPLRVIPSCIVGSAVAGALSTIFKCTLMAPHGGIFVFPVVGNWGWYLVSLAAGTVVGAIMLGTLKKNVK